MELREQRPRLTLAQKLLRKVRELSGCAEDQIGEWLLKCAVGRGATHYERDFPSNLPPDAPALGNEELGVALCLGHLPWNPAFVRAAAQLLSAPDIDATKLVRLAEMERVEPVLLHIAEAAARVAAAQEPWAWLRAHLPCRRKVRGESLPHWSRFVSQSGVTAFGGGPRIDWLCRGTTAP
jgi:hypothetical protein